ncbi:DUF2975 domain-containing protein [Pontibacter arcticus]|uniref:DUF2975 domain-containing protein n=1 Tax=Pontibacter arcticus TaxID=2080288 RepID=A0A364RBT7_9BACT|nr:DUF2975 domain-containing protein [Pontibacter arcticus]RAU81739.1 DUF2975 domain-containing protein [Pontibacter arcticus]
MKTNTHFIFTTVNVLFWIVFIGLCIKTGALLFSFFVSLFINPAGSQNLYSGLNLSGLHHFSRHNYISIMSLLIALSALKAYMAFLVIQIFQKIDLSQPFNVMVSKLINNISEVALGAGILAIIAEGYAKWLYKKSPDIGNLHQYFDNGSEFLFLAGIIFVIAQIFKKGVEIQSENELTV